MSASWTICELRSINVKLNLSIRSIWILYQIIILLDRVIDIDQQAL